MNIVEAILVAEELGGQLPTYDQWLQAAGANGNGPPPGPAGPERGAGEDLRQRPLALGLRGGPWPVGKPTTDVSVYGIHQLVTNGYEWCDTDREGKRTNLRSRPSGSFQPRLTAVPYEEHRVLTFAQIAQKTQVCEWTSTAENAGFRVVLVPR